MNIWNAELSCMGVMAYSDKEELKLEMKLAPQWQGSEVSLYAFHLFVCICMSPPSLFSKGAWGGGGFFSWNKCLCLFMKQLPVPARWFKCVDSTVYSFRICGETSDDLLLFFPSLITCHHTTTVSRTSAMMKLYLKFEKMLKKSKSCTCFWKSGLPLEKTKIQQKPSTDLYNFIPWK